MLRARVIPCLLLRDTSLVKTVRFGKFRYIGDPTNTARIFNELEVDELVILDIMATRSGRGPNFEVLAELVDECFMPLSYGGGITELGQMGRLFKMGFEKVVINSASFTHPELVQQAAEKFGSQAIIGSVDARRTWLNSYEVRSQGGTRKERVNPVAWARELERLGAGEILITSIDRDGTWSGYDLDLLRSVSAAVRLPVIGNGGAGSLEHIRQALGEGGASAVGLGSLVVFQGPDLGVLVNFPDRGQLEAVVRNQTEQKWNLP